MKGTVVHMGKQDKSSVKLFFEKNKSLVFLLPLLAVLIVVAVIVLTRSDKAVATADFSETTGYNSENQVIVLPQTNRIIDEQTILKNDPFESPLRLTGIIYSNDSPLAIIETGNLSSIVGVGSTVGASSWKVVRIDRETVFLSDGSSTATLDIKSNVQLPD